MSRKMMLVTFMVLPFLAARPVLAQDTLKLDLGKALEIALSENPTVKVADKEIQKKKYACRCLDRQGFGTQNAGYNMLWFQYRGFHPLQLPPLYCRYRHLRHMRYISPVTPPMGCSIGCGAIPAEFICCCIMACCISIC